MNRMFSSIPGFHPLDASSAPFPPSCDNSKCLQTLPNVPWRPKLPLVENHWPDITFLRVSAYFSCSKPSLKFEKIKYVQIIWYLMVKIGIQLHSCIIFWPNWRVEIPPINPSWLFQVKRNQGASNFWKPAVFERSGHLDSTPPSPRNIRFLVKDEENHVGNKTYSCENWEDSSLCTSVSTYQIGQEAGLLNSKFGEGIALSLPIRWLPSAFSTFLKAYCSWF